MQERQQPETLRLRGVSPSFTVNDIQASLAFYRDVLGFTVVQTYDNEGTLQAVLLKAGSVRLFLNQDDFSKGREREKGTAFRLWCVTAQDIDQLAAEIQDRGGELAEPVGERPWGAKDFTVVDPDGFKLSFTTPME